MPANDKYSVAFYGDGSPMQIEVIKGSDYSHIENLTKYIDVLIPADAVAELTVSSYGQYSLVYDTNGDSIPDTYINSTFSINGTNAADIESPVISFDYQLQGSNKVVTLTATDNLSGVRKIYYSLDGQQFSEYAVAVSVSQNLDKIYVFAEDNNYNRTGIAALDILGNSYSIGNRIWFDTNNDGKINNGAFPPERGAINVSVSLFADNNADGQIDDVIHPLKSTITDGDGYYRFDDLGTGNYIVRVNPSNFANGGVLSGFLNTTLQSSENIDSDSTHSGENGVLPNGAENIKQVTGVLSNSIKVGQNLSEPLGETETSADDKSRFDGYTNLTVDFGFYRLTLGGTVWNDVNNNGILNDGEFGLVAYRVELFETNGREVPVGADGILGTSDDSMGGILTNTAGNYSFQGLNEGDYIVKVRRNGLNVSSVTSNNPNDNIDFDNNGKRGVGSDEAFAVSSPITLSSASRGAFENTNVNEFTGITENTTLDFGLNFAPTAANVSLSGQTIDANGRAISNASVIIKNLSNNQSKTARTNPFGRFIFGELSAAGIYIITITHKQFTFDAQVVNLNNNQENVHFKGIRK